MAAAPPASPSIKSPGCGRGTLAPGPLPPPPGQHWLTLEHNGVLFPPEYVPHGRRVRYQRPDGTFMDIPMDPGPRTPPPPRLSAMCGRVSMFSQRSFPMVANFFEVASFEIF